jgi:hypothetical protein
MKDGWLRHIKKMISILNKFELVRKNISGWHGKDLTLLDVGCRGCELREYIKDLVQYRGVDLFQNSEGSVDFVLDVEKGLPMPDESYDFVAALDLVEHLNDFQGGLEELLRVTRKCLLVVLPNLAHTVHRKEFFLRGRLFTGKYDLKYNNGIDRHRWLTVIPQTDEYMRRFADDKKVHLEILWFNTGIKMALFEKIGRFLRLSPSWWVGSSLYILTKEK